MAGLCFVVGARPNFMKAAPVVAALRAQAPALDVTLVHTGQHYDADMSDIFLQELGLPKPDVFLGVGSGSHAEQTARALVGVEAVLRERTIDLVVVPGDVNSTLAAALAAVKLGVPVAHLEAGLRSFDQTMPEEHNRKVTDHLSALLLVHSAGAVDNLAREGIAGDQVVLVGNTMIDSLATHVGPARAARPWASFGVEEGGYGLVTLHRPALTDDDALLRETAEALAELAVTSPLVFPVHPRTRARLEALGLAELLTTRGVRLSGPLGYLAFLGLEAGARFVLTDSGGVQEETSALGVQCFTLRATTERPITTELGTNRLLGLDPRRIAAIPELLLDPRPAVEIPLWDGKAADRCVTALVGFLGQRTAVGSAP